MEKELKKRKINRLKNFDYSSCGAYFITICTFNRRNIFWSGKNSDIDFNGGKTVGTGIARPQRKKGTANAGIVAETTIALPRNIELSRCGIIVNDAIQSIPSAYPVLSLDGYVIMPNHIHLLLQVCSDENGRPMVAPTISRIINQFKGIVSKKAGIGVWQKSFYDHVIRNYEDYIEHQKYICENPMRWLEDELYIEP